MTRFGRMWMMTGLLLGLAMPAGPALAQEHAAAPA